MNKKKKEKKEINKEILKTKGKKGLKEYNKLKRIEGVNISNKIIESKKYKKKYKDKELERELKENFIL